MTALAVLLSIRRESLFIAVLGLLGGFATPALLSTGENRPVPLFAYLLLLNVGLAWVAYRQVWPVLTVLTLVLTTIYQWGWVIKFLSQSDLSLAMGIFLVFPIVSFAGLLLARRPVVSDDSSDENSAFELTAIAAAVLPVIFAAYLAAVPAYGAHATLLFGFLALIDAGLLAVALGRNAMVVHAIGALATVVVLAVWLSTSYRPDLAYTVLAFTSAFVFLYLSAPVIAGWVSRPLSGVAAHAVYASPVLLFAFPVLAKIEPVFASPLVLFGVLLGLVLLCAWRAVATSEAFLYFIAAFFAVGAQAVWSAEHLTVDRLGTVVVLYGVFGLLNAGVPAVARRIGRTLEPQWAAGIMLLASLGLLTYLASGALAPVALWALALLLAMLNAALFIESASARLPVTALTGTVLSWLILAAWWSRAAASVGVLPSLAVLGGLSLVTLGGYAWADRRAPAEDAAASFANGLYLSLIGHFFLFFIAGNREWALPPWPLFGTLAVITLATSATSLATRKMVLHTAGAIAAAVVVMTWTVATAMASWSTVGLAASAAVSAFALAWIAVARRSGGVSTAAVGAAAVLFIAELTVIVVTGARQRPHFVAMLGAHVVTLAVLLALTWSQRWPQVAVGAALTGALGVFAWQVQRLGAEWRELLILAGALYAVFTAYPLIVGPRARGDREPWMVALISAATTFFAARAAFLAAGLGWMIGVVPVVQGLVTVVLLRALLRLERPGERDLGRLAVVAGAALSFVTVAIPLQLEHQWITIGWALEGAALAWLYGRIPHRGLLLASAALLSTVFVRLALNPAVFVYEPRGALRIFNWYLYTYVIVAAALFAAAWWFRKTEDRISCRLAVIAGPPGRGRHSAVHPLEHRDRRLLRHGPGDYVPLWRHGFAGPHLHDRLARLRNGAARRGDLRGRASCPRRGRFAHRGHHVQVFLVRPGVARRPVPRRLFRRPRDVACDRLPRAAEIRTGEAEGSVMTRRAAAGVLLGGLIASVSVLAQQPARSFRVERPIVPTGAGPQRLAIDVPLLARSQRMNLPLPALARGRGPAGLSDLRIVDAQGREVPYLLVHSPPEHRWVTSVLLPVAATKKTSGFEADLGAVQTVDTLSVDGLPAPFLKRLTLEGSGDRERWTMLAAEGTLFNLPQEALLQLTVPFRPGDYRYLRVTWDDTNSGRMPLPQSARARVVDAHAIPHVPVAAAVSVERRPSEPEMSRYRLRLPAAGLPIVALTLDVGPGRVFRRATVSEARLEGALAAPVELGRARLSRVERDGLSASGLRIPIQQPRESELQLLVEDGSNPPLDLKSVSIELAELPWIYFEAPGGSLTARYGNASAAPPAYDLEAVRGQLKLADTPEARWGQPLDTTPSEPEPPPYVPETGAPIAQEGFRYRRSIPVGPGGLTALSLDAAALAHSRGPAESFADVRIADQAGRQVPYLLERRGEPISVPLTLRPATSRVPGLAPEPGRHRSVYAVTLPYPRLPSPRLVLETSDRVFQRPVQVVVERRADRDHRDAWFNVKAATVWVHNTPDVAAHAAMMPLAIHDETELLIVVDEGDNRPLAITGARLLLPSWRVRFFGPPAPLTLLYGHDALSSPRYDLALLAPQVMGAEARDVEAAAEAAGASAPSSALSPLTPRMFWMGLSLAVLVLLAVIGKLVVSSSGAPSPPSPPAP